MIEYLDYKGNKLPFRVSYYALKHYQLETGKDISEIGEDMGNFEILLFYALEAGYKATEKPMPYKRDDMEVILDECFMDFSTKMRGFFPKVDSITDDKKK